MWWKPTWIVRIPEWRTCNSIVYITLEIWCNCKWNLQLWQVSSELCKTFKSRNAKTDVFSWPHNSPAVIVTSLKCVVSINIWWCTYLLTKFAVVIHNSSLSVHSIHVCPCHPTHSRAHLHQLWPLVLFDVAEVGCWGSLMAVLKRVGGGSTILLTKTVSDVAKTHQSGTHVQCVYVSDVCMYIVSTVCIVHNQVGGVCCGFVCDRYVQQEAPAVCWVCPSPLPRQTLGTNRVHPTSLEWLYCHPIIGSRTK